MYTLQFSFEIFFRSGQKMGHVDSLSRNVVPHSEEQGTVMSISVDNFDWVAALQTQDGKISNIRKILEGLLPAEKDILKSYKMVSGRVFRITPTGLKFVVPTGVRFHVVKSMHDDMGHPGVDKTTELITQDFWFEHMNAFILKYVKCCVECAANKRGLDETRFQIHTHLKQPIPFWVVHADYCGPFPKSKRQNTQVLGIIDAFSRFIILRPTRSCSTAGVVSVLKEVAQYFGFPKIIVSDRGAAFTSKLFAEFCAESDVKHSPVAAKTPRGNGQIEKCFQFATSALKCFSADKDERDWDLNLPAVQWAMNAMKNRTTGESPQMVLLGYRPRNILHNKLLHALRDETDLGSEVESLPDIRQRALERMTSAAEKQAERHNTTHKTPLSYSEGDLVLLRYEPPADGGSRKLMPRFRGPYVVDKVLGADRYVVKDTPATRVTQKPFESVYAADKMKPWGQPPESDFPEVDEEGGETADVGETEEQ